jgi:hypothetical protein
VVRLSPTSDPCQEPARSAKIDFRVSTRLDSLRKVEISRWMLPKDFPPRCMKFVPSFSKCSD